LQRLPDNDKNQFAVYTLDVHYLNGKSLEDKTDAKLQFLTEKNRKDDPVAYFTQFQAVSRPED